MKWGLNMNSIVEALSYSFIIRALVVGSFIGLSAAFLGIYLVLLRQSMIGDGLAHVGFLTIAIALVLDKSPIIVSLPITILAALLIIHLDEKANINNDTAIGLISAFAVALAILISSLASGFNVDLNTYLFGSILTIKQIDVYFSVVLSLVVVSLIIFNFNSLFALSFDEEYAKILNVNVRLMKYLIAVLTAITVVLGIRVVGTMLISSMILFPTVSALQISKGFKDTILYASLISVLSIFIGIFSSYVVDIPTGSTIVIVNAIIFTLLISYRRFIYGS